MHIPNNYDTSTVISWDWAQQFRECVTVILEVLGQLFTGFPGSLTGVLGFLFYWIHKALTQPSEWTVSVFYATVELVHTHIYWAHLIAWSIFFGPIVVLVPFLLVHEILIFFAYNFTYILHGITSHSLPDQYEDLRLSLLDTRESLFSFVDRSSNVFNKWTADHMPLMVFRLTAGALGSILLYAIWMGW
ncbi:hypothetical protein D9756_005120 [Leucocoprinus leucothites]|uniref:Uncharacterized protein n=1 Tax=Leucocoprinus leucothites TaxID=201217 RepID=A0A8H5G9T8_9AGAR|nr:hypothetical protein D9756_005120 [Leucoagaricus leucothites]